MAHFAEIIDGKVERVIVVNNSECLKDGVEDEATGAVFCHKLLGGEWVQTSYNGNKRFNYAGKGYTFDKDMDAFYPPQPFKSWKLDEKAKWQPPVPMPAVKSGATVQWDESTTSWKEETK